MSEALTELAQHIEARRPNAVTGWAIAFGELNITVDAGQVARPTAPAAPGAAPAAPAAEGETAAPADGCGSD